MKYLSIFCALIALSSCHKQQPAPVCDMLFKAVTASAQAVAVALQCQNVPAIAADLSQPLTKFGFCAVTPQSTLADFVCPQLSQVVATLSVTAIPASWQCSGQVAGDLIKQKVSDVCAQIVK